MQLWSNIPNLYLLTPRQFELVPDGMELVSINGNRAVKGRDYIDDDTRANYLAYGFIDPYNTLDKELLTMLLLAHEK